MQRGCTEADLKKAFRKAAMECHPDRNGGCKDSEARFKELNEAYSILSDPDKRAAYDRFGHAGVNGMGGGPGQAGFGDIHDIFNEVFGDAFGDMFGGGQRRRRGPQRGQDVRYDLTITLEQAFAGTTAEIRLPSSLTCETCAGSGAAPGSSAETCMGCGGAGRVRAQQGFFSIERTCPRCGGQGTTIAVPCADCHGIGQVRKDRTLEVKIPPGVDDGARIRLSGEGHAGAQGGPRGDLYIFISVQPHELFERDGLDLCCTVPVPMCTAALGGEIEAPCLTGGPNCDGECRIDVNVPAGTQTGHILKLKGKGMPSLRGRERGDLLVEIFVETPTNLTGRQKELLRELASGCSDKQHPRAAGFVGKAKKFWDGITGTEERV
ncbi:MAG: molecular chaperone DnaJ [Caulobacteraceae bacterium]